MAYRVIVADSSYSVQKVVQMAFSGPEFEVYPFADGLEVVKSLDEIKPDALVVNLSLPLKDGYEVGSHLREHEEFSQTALFFLRGAFEPLDLERVSQLDCDEILQKPFDSEKLTQLVRDAIDRKRGPLSFPEEMRLDEIGLLEEGSDLQAKSLRSSVPQEEPPFLASLYPGESPGVEEKVREIVKQEILGLERELEKRIKAQIRLELGEWLEDKLKNLKPKDKI